MAKYLVVAHETVTNPMLFEELKKIEAGDNSAEFTLLVPATPIRHLLFRRGSEQEATKVAGHLVDEARRAFEKNDIKLVEARVGSESPVEAVDTEVSTHPGYTGFVISTLAQEKSRWLRLDLPTLVESKYGLPVHHVTAPLNYFVAGTP